MNIKKKTLVGKKFVSFSDDNVISHSSRLANNANNNSPQVYVKHGWLTVPIHIPLLCYYFVKQSERYNYKVLFWYLVPCQLAYLILQFNKCTLYDNNIMQVNYILLIISAVISFMLTIPCTVILVLFGAPFLQFLDRTWWLSLHICTLAFPVVYSVCNSNFKLSYFKKYFIMIAVGCWISCMTLPLDWDKPWQEWPIPLLIGAYLGAFFGYTFGAFI